MRKVTSILVKISLLKFQMLKVGIHLSRVHSIPFFRASSQDIKGTQSLLALHEKQSVPGVEAQALDSLCI